VSSRVSPTEQIHAEIDALFTSGRDLAEVLEDVARLGARLIMQHALEAEVDAFLGRARYQRRAETPEARAGSRNGFCPVTVKTTTGRVTLARPKLRDTTDAFTSRLFGTGVCRTNALETLVIAGHVRGLSTRDVEASLADALGPQAALSRSTVSRVCQTLTTEFDTWRQRRLDDLVLDSLFVDASHFAMHPGARAEPVLAAWGITTAGKPVLIGLAPAANEGNDAWDGFFTDLVDRGLRPPLLVVSDGAAGLVGAIERGCPRSLRQRCLVHRARNVLAKIPKGAQVEVKAAYWAMFDLDETIQPGPGAETLVQQRLDAFAATYGKTYPAAVRCLLTDRQALTAHLRFPREHRTRIRHSNLIERTFGETRRRTKVIGRFPGETSCVTLVWAVLDRASRGWRGFPVTATATRLLQDLRRQLLDPPAQIRRHTTKVNQPAAVAA
jgi:putative transposase